MATAKRGERPAWGTLPRGPRADSVANRARILEAAAAAFDAEGLRVSLDEIARRAGVGPGTVHRHFPSKAALIDATVAGRVTALADEAAALRDAADPVGAFAGFLTVLVERGSASHALADRLRGQSGDLAAAVAGPTARLRDELAALLARAQQAGGIRADLTPAQLDAVIAGAHAAYVHPHGGAALVRLLLASLRT